VSDSESNFRHVFQASFPNKIISCTFPDTSLIFAEIPDIYRFSRQAITQQSLSPTIPHSR